VKSVGDISSGADGQTPTPQILIYTVSRHLKAEKLLSLKLGAGYSPEEQLTGSIALDEINLLGFAESSKLSYLGGPQTQKVRFTFDRPFANNETRGWQVKTLGVNVQYFSDNDTRFGNLTPDEIAMRETGSAAQASIAYDSFSLLDHATADCLDETERKRTRFHLLATPVFAYRDVNIKEDNLLLTITQIDRSLLPTARTQTSTFSLDTIAGISHDFRTSGQAGAGMLSLTLNGRLQRGFRFFGADYNFNKVNVTVGAEFLFGFKSWRDLLLRYNRVMGTSTHGTPIFELQRLGGSRTVRGFEEGEAIGRKLSADQFEAGINALLLWNLITHKPVADTLLKTDCTDSEDPSSRPPFDIRNAYLKFFYDRGRIHDADSFLAPGNTERTAQGYGVAIELRQVGGQNINLSLGYAHSPESSLHKKGTIYTGVSYSF
jgi:outer membrane protein assembly factor BamA